MAWSDYSTLTNLFDENFGFRHLRLDLFHDINLGERDALFRTLRALYFTSPIAKKMVEKPIQLLFENGLKIKFNNDRVSRAYHNYISNNFRYTFPFNHLLEQFVRSLLVDGEIFIPLIKYDTGEVEFGYIAPILVRKLITEDDNYLVLKQVEYAKQKIKNDEYLNIEETKLLRYDIAHIKKNKFGINIEGDIIYYRLSNFPGMRGRGLLEIVMDLAYAYNEMVLDIMRRQKILSSFVWDVCIQGADRVELQERKEEFSKNPIPSSGGARFRNEKEEWNIISPDLKNDDYNTSSKIVLNHIFTGQTTLSREDLGLESSSDNEIELMIRYVNFLINNYIIDFIKKIIDCVLNNCIKLGMIGKSIDLSYDILYERHHTEMIRHLSVSLFQMVSAMKIAREKGWVSDNQVREVISGIINSEGDNDGIVRLSFGDMNSVINLVSRAKDMGFIDDESAVNIVKDMLTSKEYEIIGGSLEYRLGDSSGATGDRNENPSQPTQD